MESEKWKVKNGKCKVKSAKYETGSAGSAELAAYIREFEERYGNLSERFVQYAVRIIRTAMALPKNDAALTIRRQVLSSGTSVGANYEEGCAAESRADFLHKLKIVLKELRETRFWLRVIRTADLLPSSKLKAILQETDELIAIVTKSLRTAGSKDHAKR